MSVFLFLKPLEPFPALVSTVLYDLYHLTTVLCLLVFVLFVCFLGHLFTGEWARLYRNVHVEVRRQPVGVGALLPPCRAWALNSGRQAWHQAPFPREPSCPLY